MSNDPGKQPVVENPWGKLAALTSARIALGRVGTSLPTKPHLEFQLAHARARNAVHHELDWAALCSGLSSRGLDVIELESAAPDRPTYLQRPDLGRRLSSSSAGLLQERFKASAGYDVCFVVADGLSAKAIEENVLAFLDTMLPVLKDAAWSVAPIMAAKQARVAIGDEVGAISKSQLCVMLIGERPGLSSPDSLGIYLTYDPKPGLTDEARNCISNVRKAGLSYQGAAHKLLFLMTEARRRKLSGVNLKDEAEALAADAGRSVGNFLLLGG